VPGEGRRRGLPGALLLGYWDGDRFVYAGRCGTGFTNAMLTRLAEQMRQLQRETSPFDAGRPPGGAHFIEPRLVGEVEFAEWTSAGDLRRRASRGLRQDKHPRAVVREVAGQASGRNCGQSPGSTPDRKERQRAP
jgi:bifunctional non-homologous end joining protein LigD